jgi:hypothetical protein
MGHLKARERPSCDRELLWTSAVRDVALDEDRIDAERVDPLDCVLIHELPVRDVGIGLACEGEPGRLVPELVVFTHRSAEAWLAEVEIVERREGGDLSSIGLGKRLERAWEVFLRLDGGRPLGSNADPVARSWLKALDAHQAGPRRGTEAGPHLTVQEHLSRRIGRTVVVVDGERERDGRLRPAEELRIADRESHRRITLPRDPGETSPPRPPLGVC